MVQWKKNVYQIKSTWDGFCNDFKSIQPYLFILRNMILKPSISLLQYNYLNVRSE